MRDVTVRRIKIAAVIFLFGGGSGGVGTGCFAVGGKLHAATRLIAGASVKSTDAKWARAEIEIRLDPGWKTYWRYPATPAYRPPWISPAPRTSNR